MMWKILVGFVAFAALAVFVLSKGGDIDISGEKHGAAPISLEKSWRVAATAEPAALKI